MDNGTSILLLAGSGVFFIWALVFSFKQCVKIRAEQKKISSRYDDRIYYETI